MSNQIVYHFLEGLITLTKERDSDNLEQSMLKTMQNLFELIGCEVDSVEILRLKDISKLFFAAISGHQNNQVNDNAEYYQQLMECYNTSSYRKCDANSLKATYFFPLRNPVAYLNSFVVVSLSEGNINDDIAKAICQLLHVYQNYTNIINDNERDNLTGLLNRKTFDTKISRIMSQLNHTNMRVNDNAANVHYLAIFDIDHFKKVNDVHGHLIGDEVLLLFSQLMTKVFRETDPIFRFGGEEFVALFSCTTASDIVMILDRFKQHLKDFTFPQIGKITASVGYTEIKGDVTPSQYIDRADLALYFAKNNGRNRICHYESLVDQGLITEQVTEGEIELF